MGFNPSYTNVLFSSTETSPSYTQNERSRMLPYIFHLRLPVYLKCYHRDAMFLLAFIKQLNFYKYMFRLMILLFLPSLIWMGWEFYRVLEVLWMLSSELPVPSMLQPVSSLYLVNLYAVVIKKSYYIVLFKIQSFNYFLWQSYPYKNWPIGCGNDNTVLHNKFEFNIKPVPPSM